MATKPSRKPGGVTEVPARTTSAGRIPPQNIDAEVSTLGALLLDQEAMLKVIDILSPEDFYRPDYGTIYEAMVVLSEKRTPVDIVTVSDELSRVKKLEEIGGKAALSSLVSAVATASNVQHYAQIIREKAMLRRLIHAAGTIGELGFHEEQPSSIILDEAEKTLFAVTQRFLRQNFVPVRSILTESFERLDALSKQDGSIRGLSTGYKHVDHILGGLQESDLIILAARPSMGKCVTGETQLLQQSASGWEKIRIDAVKGGETILSLDSETGAFESRTIKKLMDMGKKPVFRLVTQFGEHLKTTANHPFLVLKKPLEPEKKTQSTVFEVDQSPRMEKFGQDCVVALANQEQGFSIRVTKKNKQELFEEYFQGKKPKRFGPELFVAAIVKALEQMPEVTRLKIDLEYAGYELFISNFIHRFFPHTDVEFKAIGRNSQAHLVAYSEFTQKKGTTLASSSLEGDLATELFHPEFTGIRNSHDRFLQREYNEKLPLSSSAEWIKAEFLKPGMTIATLHGWQKISALYATGVEQVWDIEVEGTHTFMGNNIVAHNTAFALDIAKNVAVGQKKTVGLFSLEMSKEQLVDRLISSIGLIDSWKLRNGKLNDEDFQNLNEAYGLLAEANLFIDDTASANVMEVRAKARRLQAEHGLDLVVIDYLQLMEGSSRNSENRVQEVSEISRSLKALAREMKCPVLALSQLSRAVESRPDKHPMLSDLRESGCVAGDTLIMRADTGKRVPIKELVGQTDIPVWSLDEDYQLVKKNITRVFSSGYKQLFELKFRSGRTIKASANHKFKTYDSWIRLDQLKVDQELALSGSHEDNPAMYWEKITSITPLEIEEVFDATVPETHNFVANDVVVHNSIEQDADVVIFLYRDDYYNKEETNNLLEVMVRKHRNGPTGDAKLLARLQYGRFETLTNQQFSQE